MQLLFRERFLRNKNNIRVTTKLPHINPIQNQVEFKINLAKYIITPSEQHDDNIFVLTIKIHLTVLIHCNNTPANIFE